MSRKFIAGLLAVSITIAGFSAAPARAADADDVARFLGAAATLFILGKAIEQSRRDDAPKAYSHQRKPLPRVVPRKHRKAHRAAPLPRRCLRNVTGARTKTVMGARCLQRNYKSARPLPASCRLKVSTARGIRPAYSTRCLRKRGYRVAAR